MEAPQKLMKRNGEYPILAKLKARNLYLQEGLGAKAISEATGIPDYAIHRMSHREGWVAIRRANRARLLQKQDARTNAIGDQVIEAIAAASEEHAIRALQKTGEALERTDRDAAKDAQAYSSTVKNLAGVAKAMRDPGAAAVGEGSNTFNLFFVGRSEAIGPAKLVTEIEATPKSSAHSQ